MGTPPPRPRTLEEAITAALAAGDEATAAALLRRAFGRPAQQGANDLAELLEELAEYFVSLDRYDDALAAATRAAEMSADTSESRRRRARVAHVMLGNGFADEACALYAALAEEAMGETWIHEAAGSDYIDAGEFDLAYAWLTAGLEVAVANEQPSECVRRLCGLRRIAMMALGMPADDLDNQDCSRFSYPDLDGATPRSDASDAEAVLLGDALDTGHVARNSALRLLAMLRASSGHDVEIVLPKPEGASTATE